MRTLALTLLLGIAACGAVPTLPTPAAPAAPAMPEAPTTATPELAAPERPDLGALLGGITDGASAAAAKGPLEAALGQLKNALAGADAKAKVEGAAGGGTDTAGRARQLAGDVLAKFGLGAGTVDTITKLLDDPAVQSAIGPALEQLRGLLAGGG